MIADIQGGLGKEQHQLYWNGTKPKLICENGTE
jgi:hypothetical protein